VGHQINSSMNKIWKYLDIDAHQAISDEVYQYLADYTDVLLGEKYFVDQSIHHMLRHCPLLAEFLNSCYLVPERLATITCLSHDEINIHKDFDGEDPYVRILWPVKNCQGSKTKFWKVPSGAGHLTIGGYGTRDGSGITSIAFPKNDDYEVIDEFELSSPLVFDGSVAHSIHPNPNLSGLRVSFTIGFDRDLPISKSIKAWFGFQR
jgi:hypothetical protein